MPSLFGNRRGTPNGSNSQILQPIASQEENASSPEEITCHFDENNPGSVHLERHELIQRNSRDDANDFISKKITIPRPSGSDKNVDTKDGVHDTIDGTSDTIDGDTTNGTQDKQASRNEPTNAYGEIKFTGYLGRHAKYVRLDAGYTSNMGVVKELAMKYWELEKPELILSITGGTKRIFLSRKLAEAFIRALHKISLHTATWVITAGTNYGVSKFTGKAVRDCSLARHTNEGVVKPVSAIGIASWNCVQKKEKLIRNKGKEYHTVDYNVKEKNEGRHQRYLDPYHSHFLLVDDGTDKCDADVEIKFRAAFENEIRGVSNENGYSTYPISDAKIVPSVVLVMEGGVGSLKTVLAALETETPVLLIQGSGRVADILVFAVHNAEELLSEASSQTQCHEISAKKELLEMIKTGLKGKDENVLYKDVIKCLEYRRLIRYFDGDNITDDMDIEILDTLLLNSAFDKGKTLQLALAWDRLDIFQNEETSKELVNLIKSEDLIYSAMTLNRPYIVKHFIEYCDVSPKDIAKPDLLKRIFIDSKCEPVCRDWETWKDVKNTLDNLVGDFAVPTYLRKLAKAGVGNGRTTASRSESVLSNGTNTSTNLSDVTSSSRTLHDETDLPKRSDACQTLFILCVLLNRQKLAKIFWEEGKNGISCALVAHGILKALANETDDTEKRKKLIEDAEEFNSFAIGLLKLCNENNAVDTAGILNRGQVRFSDNNNDKKEDTVGTSKSIMNSVDIAYATRNKTFTDTAACQSVFMDKWMGRIHKDTSSVMMILCLLIPPLLFCLKFKKRHIECFRKSSLSKVGRNLVPYRTLWLMYHCFTRKEDEGYWIDAQSCKTEHMYKWYEKIYYFFASPWIIAVLNVVSYVIFLTIYTYVLLVGVHDYLSIFDIILMVWVLSMFVEEVRQCIGEKDKALKRRFQNYIKSVYNQFDILTIILFTVGMILRFSPGKYSLDAGRVMLGFAFLIFCMRILHIFTVNRQLGPWLVMIRRMTLDLVYFFIILMVFVVSYAIAAYAIAFPNRKLDFLLVYNVLRLGYWNVYGELFLDEIEVDEPNCSFNETIYTNDPEITQCPTHVGRYIVPILRGVYVLFSNILLLNLLISIFCNTYATVQEKASIHWSFERYEMIREYQSRPILPAPFSLLLHISFLARWIFEHCCGRCCCKNLFNGRAEIRCKECNGICPSLYDERKTRHLIKWEKVNMIKFLENESRKKQEVIDSKVQESIDSVWELRSVVEELKAAIDDMKTNSKAESS